MERWNESPIYTDKFKRGFDKIAFTSEDEARETLKKYFKPEELEEVRIYKRDFSSNKFVVRLPYALGCPIIGKNKYFIGFPAAFINYFKEYEILKM